MSRLTRVSPPGCLSLCRSCTASGRCDGQNPGNSNRLKWRGCHWRHGHPSQQPDGYDRTVKSDAEGYQFLAVPIGEGYEVIVSGSGFRKAVQTGITLLVNQDYRADFKLEVGTASQTVEAIGGCNPGRNHEHAVGRRHSGHQDGADAAEWPELCRSDWTASRCCSADFQRCLLSWERAKSLGAALRAAIFRSMARVNPAMHST